MRQVEVMWSPAKAAAHLGLNVQTVYRMIKRGEIQNVMRLGRIVRIPLSEIQRLTNNVRRGIEVGAIDK